MSQKETHHFKQNKDYYYRVEKKRKKILQLHENKLEYIDYDLNIDDVLNYKSLKENNWNNLLNMFFLENDFEWEYKGKKFKTTNNKDIQWRVNSLVFHNGKIWSLYDFKPPRIYLKESIDLNNIPIRKLFCKSVQRYKWTDMKYCKNFVEVK